MTRRWWRAVVAVLAVLVLVAGVLAGLAYRGLWWPNRLLAAGHPVRAVDVSRYQGDIDWPVLAGQGIAAAYLKATEGTGYVDPTFAASWAAALDTDLLVGGYHFFSFDSTGAAQADHVIATLPAVTGTLPPMVDLELYGGYRDDPPPAGAVRAELTDLLDRLRTHYGAEPVVYVTAETYDRYLADHFPGTPVWIRSVIVPPRLSDGRDWTWWQYSNRDRLDGYRGEEEFIDMNAYAGTLADLRATTQP